MRTYRVGLSQIDPTVGDLAGNGELIRAGIARARDAGCALVAFPELAVTGYPPEDLVLRRSFCEASRAALAALAPATTGIVAIVGFVDWAGDAYNAAAVLADGVWVDTYHKHRLPNYGVFDEERTFAAGERLPVFHAGGLVFAVTICEDLWYAGLPLDALALEGAELCINVNASPYRRGRLDERKRMIATRAADNVCAVAYVNAVGGQDELVFDGGSFVCGPSGAILGTGPQFAEDLVVVDVDLDDVGQRRLHDPRRRAERRERRTTELVEQVIVPFVPPTATPPARRPAAPDLAADDEVWQALVLGTRDYLAKTGFTEAVIGLSGGIDSALVAAIAVDAIGREQVVGVAMPSRFSSVHSVEDARAVAAALGIRLLEIPIEPAHAAMLAMLEGPFAGTTPGTAEENLQARQRGNVLMTLSNKFGWIVLTTGNKSEMATGYATLYGDMAGGFAVIKDVPKTLVYRLARWRNEAAGRTLIPERVLAKPPSAELHPGQLDVDGLPPYEVLDPILEAYVEGDRTLEEIVALGHDAVTVRRVIDLVDRAEYKRRQAPPGVNISPRAFGRDRRFPLASRWRGV
ncbi:MAG: NAD+ synthase [Candidatus Limnocylindria bacterium]|nr:NAD+ synthase [Candidatus Limnocylindria bacterium]